MDRHAHRHNSTANVFLCQEGACLGSSGLSVRQCTNLCTCPYTCICACPSTRLCTYPSLSHPSCPRSPARPCQLRYTTLCMVRCKCSYTAEPTRGFRRGKGATASQIGHNYIGHNYIGHNYIGQWGATASQIGGETAVALHHITVGGGVVPRRRTARFKRTKRA